uniref:Uncharacterized protein n=1 Tax=Anguilla anguilla TaxID=7936 RepID=A0A0E9TC25_ANGAN
MNRKKTVTITSMGKVPENTNYIHDKHIKCRNYLLLDTRF